MVMTMNKKKLKIISFLIAGIAVIVAATIVFQTVIGGLYVKKFETAAAGSSHIEQNYDSADLSRFPQSVISAEGYERVAETEKLALLLRNDNLAVKLYDKRTGKMWSSSPEEEVILQSATSDAVKKRMRSLFTFNYVDLTNIRESKKEINLPDASPSVERRKIKNGASLDFKFENFAIEFSLELTIAGDEFYCTIPNDKILENEEMAAEISEKKEDIQKRIDEFQTLADSFQKKLESSDYDETVITVIKLFSNEIFNILVKAKETTGTESFQPSQFEYIQSDIIEIKDRLDKDSGKLYDMILQMEEDIGVIIELTNELSGSRAGGITDLDLMPYFGTGRFGDNGYVFYPDAGGAISKLNTLHSEAGGVYIQDIYDSFSPSQKSERLNKKSTKIISPALYPVFGIKVDKSAFTAVISKGDTDASIHFNPVTNSNAFGNIYGSFYFRQMTSNNNQNGESFSVYDRIRTKQDWEITYKFLADSDADYSGMARFYKEYLQRNGMLSRSSVMDREMPLTAEFMMGMEPPQDSFFRNYIKLTDFSDIEKFAKDLHGEGIDSLMVNVDAWLKHYGKLSWQSLTPAGEIGGKKGLQSLASYFNESGNLLSLTETTGTFFGEDIPRLIRSNATVKALNKISLDIRGQLYLNPYFAHDRSADNFKAYKKFGNNAITYSDMSGNLYYDYNSYGTATRGETAAVFGKIVENGRKSLAYSVQNNASALYLSQTDWNINMTSDTCGYIFTDMEVPFYQMVFHGFIPYTSNPLNEASDMEKAKLRRLELGEIPFYRLTSELPSEIKLWYNTGLFSPHLSKWFSVIVEDYKAYFETYGKLWNKEMLSHEALAEDIYRIRYDGGAEVIVNYTDKDYPYNGKSVPGQGSLII